MGYVIATRPGRTVRRARNRGVQKYAVVQSNGKFKWGADLQSASYFNSMSAAVQALGVRAQELEGEPTADVTVFEVNRAGITVTRQFNGPQGG